MKNRTYHLISLGCSKNLVDSEVFAGITESSGYQSVSDPEDADIIIVNTCGFINDAKEEAIETILESAELKETGHCKKLVVTGCLVKRYQHELESLIPEVDSWIGLKDFNAFTTLFGANCPTSLPRRLLTPGHYAYLRISDGCNNHCAYCAIPFIRGSLQSLPIESIIQEARSLAAQGVKELILTAQDTTRYGEDIYGTSHLPELLVQLHAIQDIQWIRLLYLHPNRITETLIQTIASLPKVCKYFEIPIQHAHDTMLRSMNRGNTNKGLTSLFTMIRSMIPEAVFRTTVMVGFPGETNTHFEHLKQFIIDQRFGRLGVFAFSPEDGTPAAKRTHKVPALLAQQRKDEIMSLQQDISWGFLSTYVGKKVQIIIDGKSEQPEFAWEGRTWFDAPDIDGKVFLQEGNVKPGDILDVEIIDHWEYDLVATI